jgi:hypothetical protein
MLLRVVLGITPRGALAAARRAMRVGSSFAPHRLGDESTKSQHLFCRLGPEGPESAALSATPGQPP